MAEEARKARLAAEKKIADAARAAKIAAEKAAAQARERERDLY